MKAAYFSVTVMLVAGSIISNAQTDSLEHNKSLDITVEEVHPDSVKKNDSKISLGLEGIKFTTAPDSVREKRKVEFGYFIFDLGLNFLNDKTNYATPIDPQLAANFSAIPDKDINKDLMALRNGRSWNVNIYPVMINFKLVANPSFKLNLYTGLGLQIFNFRFKNAISFSDNPGSKIYLDTVSFTKNKLSLQYLTMPLMLNLKNRIDAKTWLVYGIGVQGGYRLSSWTKQVSGERGKQKNRDPFNFRDYNFSITGEIGIDNWVRLYATYQLTNIYNDVPLMQYPISFGIRLGGF